MKKLTTLLFVLLLAGCQTTKQAEDTGPTPLEIAKPRSILVLPVVNHSVDVDAPRSVLSSLPVMLAEKGYYLFPVNTVKTVLEFEGLYEPAEVHAIPTAKIADMFGADAVLYVTINRWDTTYAVISSTTYVDFDYKIMSSTGELLWEAKKELAYTPQNNSTGSLIGDLVSAAITAAINRAAPDYMPLTRSANYQVFYGSNAIPNGPYLVPKQAAK